MVGKTKRSVFRKSRKRLGFVGVQKQASSGEQTSSNDNNNDSHNETQRGSDGEIATTSEENQTPISASSRKLSHHRFDSPQECSLDDNIGDQTPEYRVVDIQRLSSAVFDIHKCEEGNLLLEEERRQGFMSTLHIKCSSCENVEVLNTSSSITNRGTSFDVNRRLVYNSIETGCGYEGLATLCSTLNMPCMSMTAYYKQMDNIMDVLESECKEEMIRVGAKARDAILKENKEADDEQPVDIAVSFDGTWAKRGFTSLTGVVFVISVDTGEVLDYHILSKACQKCARKKSQCEDDDEFEQWKMEHEMSNQCDINFDGSSPAMEADGATILWKRSVSTHNLRYRWMVCDGDSKAFNSVEDMYPDCKVEKLDCVGHVQKRMGKHLLKLKAATKGKLKDGKTIGGQGRLTEVKIKKLQKYYGLAIRQNTIGKTSPSQQEIDAAVYQMKKNIIASLQHNVRSDDLATQHRFCPRGEKSWCKWQQDVASGTSTYKDSGCLPPVFLEVLKPVFMTLSESNLLSRCVLGATQNVNECINGVVWSRCHKHKHHGAKSVRCAVASSVLQFHSGAASREHIMRKLFIPGGEHTSKSSATKDKKRLRTADLRTTEKAKKRRQGEQLLRVRREEALKEAEGTTYEAGAF